MSVVKIKDMVFVLDEKISYDDIDIYNFDEKQVKEIKLGLEQNIPVHGYTSLIFDAREMEIARKFLSNIDTSIFSYKQLNEICWGVKSQVNVSIYAKPEFNWEQMKQIREGLESSIDISLYAKPEFNWKQMREIRLGLEQKLDPTIYADPKIYWDEMELARRGLKQGLNVSLYMDPKIDYEKKLDIYLDLKRIQSRSN